MIGKIIALVVWTGLVIDGIQLIRGKWLYQVNFFAGVLGESKEKKATFNYKFIGQAVGKFILFCALMIVLAMVFPGLSLLFLTILVIGAIVLIFYANSSNSIKK